jgi:plasmid maintenance system antidote protein VapI/uncharacterized protein YerC
MNDAIDLDELETATKTRVEKNVPDAIDLDALEQAKGVPSKSFSKGVFEGSKAGIEKTAELYKSGKIGGVKATIGTAGSIASSALGELSKGTEGMAEALPYATPGKFKFTVNPEDSNAAKIGKTIGNVPGGIYNLAAGAVNLGITGVQEAFGAKPEGTTGGAVVGGLAALGKSAIDKVGEVAVTGEEKGAVAGATKAFDIASKTLAENPTEILAGAKPQLAGDLGKLGVKTVGRGIDFAKATTGKAVGAAGKVIEGAAGKVTGASSESLRAVAGNPELAQRIMKEGGDSPAAQETYKVIDEFKNGVEKDLSEKGQLGQMYEPIRSVPVRIDQSAVEASLSEALARHGIEADPVTVANGGKLNVAASDIGRQGKALIESALQDVRDKLFKDGRLKEDLTGMDLHNARKVLDKDYLNWDATTPAGSAESAIKGLRKAIDDLAKENIPGLKELDKKFSEASTKIDEVAREFFSKKPGGGFELKQDIVSRIKNADSPMRLSDRMDILERYVPDARQRLYVSNALRQIEQAEAKFGSAHRSIPQAIGASAGAAIAGPVGAAIGFLAGSVVTPTFMAELAIKAGYAARKLGIKLKSGNEVLAASEKISRKLAKAEKLTAEEAADAAELLRAQSKVQVREKLAEEAKKENLYRTHPAYQESPLHPDFVSNQLKKAEKLKQEAEAYKKQYPVQDSAMPWEDAGKKQKSNAAKRKESIQGVKEVYGDDLDKAFRKLKDRQDRTQSTQNADKFSDVEAMASKDPDFMKFYDEASTFIEQQGEGGNLSVQNVFDEMNDRYKTIDAKTPAATNVAKEVETPVLAQAKGQETMPKKQYEITPEGIDPLDEVQQAISQNISKKDAERLIDRAYPLFKEYYKSKQDWLSQGVDNVVMEMESDFNTMKNFESLMKQNETTSKLWQESELTMHDLVDSYLKGHLKDINTNNEFSIKNFPESASAPVKKIDDKFYSAPRIKKADPKTIWESAKARLTTKNEREVMAARDDLFVLNNIDSDLPNKLGISRDELSKFVQNHSGASTKGIKIENELNTGIHPENKWTGITNTTAIRRANIADEVVANSVKKIDLNGRSFYQPDLRSMNRHISRTFMAIDTKLSYKDLSFYVKSLSERKAKGLYEASTKTITIDKNLQNTVAHEIGHYLDDKWSREFGVTGGISRYEPSWDYIKKNYGVSDEKIKWGKDFNKFVEKLTERSETGEFSSLKAEYLQDRGEVFARFVDKFVTWVDQTANKRAFVENSWYRDIFTEKQFKDFVKILQNKSYIDQKYGIKAIDK